MRLTPLLLLVSLSGSYFVQPSIAKDFGKYGATTNIKEEGFLAMIARKLKSLDIEKEQEKMQKTAREKINEPSSVKGITRTKEARSFIFDPTYTLLEDIYLPDGKLMHPAGTKVNPLDHMDLNRTMIFIDEKDKEQVTWLEERVASHKKKQEARDAKEETLIIILVAGRPLELQEKLQKVVYFDQDGTLTTKFGIRQVPAVVEQEGKMLKVEEVDITPGYITNNQQPTTKEIKQ